MKQINYNTYLSELELRTIAGMKWMKCHSQDFIYYSALTVFGNEKHYDLHIVSQFANSDLKKKFDDFVKANIKEKIKSRRR